MDARTAEHIAFLENSLRKERHTYEVLRRIVRSRGEQIKSLAFRLSVAENKLFWSQEHLKRYQRIDLSRNEKWAKAVLKGHATKQSLVGQIRKLERELQEAKSEQAST